QNDKSVRDFTQEFQKISLLLKETHVKDILHLYTTHLNRDIGWEVMRNHPTNLGQAVMFPTKAKDMMHQMGFREGSHKKEKKKEKEKETPWPFTFPNSGYGNGYGSGPVPMELDNVNIGQGKGKVSLNLPMPSVNSLLLKEDVSNVANKATQLSSVMVQLIVKQL